MTTTNASAGTDAGSGTAPADTNAGAVDTLDQDLEAMLRAENGENADPAAADGNDAAAAAGEDSAADGEGGEGEGGEGGEGGESRQTDLTPEEVTRRWQDTRAALRQERDARQAGEGRIADLERQIAELRGGGEAGGQSQQADPLTMEIPDPEQDPAGAFKAVIELARALRSERVETDRETEAATQQGAALKQVLGDFRDAETQYMQVQPDYNDAVQHLRTGMLAEFEAMGHSKEQAGALFQREVLSRVVTAMKNNRHPADALYNLAKLRGFTGPSPATAEADPEAAKKDLQRRNDAGKVSKTMSGAGGKAAGNDLSFESVNSIEDGDEFDKAFNELARAAGLAI